MGLILHSFARCGDRWVLSPGSVTSDRILLDESWSILLEPTTSFHLEDPDGKRIAARFDAASSAILFEKGALPSSCQVLELIQERPPVFRLLRHRDKPSRSIISMDKELQPALEDLAILKTSPSSWERFQLARQAAQFLIVAGFDNLIGLPFLKEVDLYDHQIKTARAVLNRFRGRALLCDEVGLGKTIEAGLVTLELYLRKLCRSILILTPPSLTAQWKGEMQRKFGLDFTASFDPSFLEMKNPWQTCDLIVASYHMAKREPHRSSIEARNWDLVIVDEAHHLRNRSTLLWKFVGALQKKYILLLTATPIQNGLEDLYNLITLLKPGLLSTNAHFKKRFIDSKDKFKAKNIDQLHGLVEETMIRNRRSSIGVQFTKRFAKTVRISPSQEESAFYQEFAAFAKKHLQGASDLETTGMGILSLQRLLGSTPMAFIKAIEAGSKKAFIPFAAAAKKLPPCAKMKTFVEWAKNLSDQAVVFTQFRTTQEALHEALGQAGVRTVVFHGGMSRLEKEKAIQLFRGESQVLLSTDSGSEGRNLQFCNILCNFDLPWNPMRIEQRIGRLSRIGQQRDVHVLNFVTAGTIEEEILHLLEAKINLFELVMGEMDMILGQMEEEKDFEERVLELWQNAGTSQEFHDKMELLGSQLIDAKKTYLKGQAYEEELFGSKFTVSE
jgi:SNF2 family DNA or RNA helicase